MTISGKWWAPLGAIVCLGVAACGGSDPGDDPDVVASTTQALAPAGSDAAFVSTTLPSNLYPGERRSVRVVMRNTGATAANEWTSSNPIYELTVPQTVPVTANIPAGETAAFDFVYTAPSASGTFTARMRARSLGAFGQAVSIPLTVSTDTTPAWGCTMVPESTTLPASLAPGENRVVHLVVRNTGTEAWPANRVGLATQDVPANRWGQTNTKLLTAPVPPGQTVAFDLLIQAPAAAGTYSFAREMKDYGGIGEFRKSGFCVSQNILVAGNPPLNAAVQPTSVPQAMAPGETRSITVSVQNTGTVTWPADGSIALYSRNTPVNVWGTTVTPVTTATAPGASAALTFNVTAPQATGSYPQKWQMRALSGASSGFFGAVMDVPVTVTNGVTPLYGAQVVTQTLPEVVTAGGTDVFTITMRNTGSSNWTRDDVLLGSSSMPVNLWGTTVSQLGAAETVGPGGTRTFHVAVQAPAAAGDYASTWRMRSRTIGFFGETADTSDISVTFCGNQRIDPGEDCDDGNRRDLDGCSADCKFQAFCGDGHVDPGELCDDGNADNFDACSNTCTTQATCGNFYINPGEECDDGNLTNGDGCNESCLREHTCGNWILEFHEECDDGNLTNGDGCSSDCKTEGLPPPCTHPLHFADPWVESAVRTFSGRYTGDILPEDVVQVTTLNLTGVSSLAGVECLTHLRSATFHFGTITDLSPLGGLTGLSDIDVSFNKVSDLSPIAGLSQLFSFGAIHNLITDVTPLAGLTNVYGLAIGQNQITDLSPLGALPYLQALFAPSNQITSIDGMASMPFLFDVELNDNHIGHLPASLSWPSVVRLVLSGNPLTSASPLSSATSLWALSLSDTQLTDIDFVSSLPSLGDLDVGSPHLADLTPIASMPGLYNLIVTGRDFPLGLTPLLAAPNLGSYSTVSVAPVDCTAEQASITALAQRGVQISVTCQ